MVKKYPAEVYQSKWLDDKDYNPADYPDPLAIEAIDCLEIYAASAQQAVFYFIHGFGFKPIAYRGPETGYRQAVNHVLEQGNIRFVVSASLNLVDPIATEVFEHGFTVKNIVLRVPSAEAFYYEAMRRGAESEEPPMFWEDEFGRVKRAGIKTYGNVIHSLAETKDYKGVFWPGYVPYEEVFPDMVTRESVGLRDIDHIVGNVDHMDRWVSFYEKVLDFRELIAFSDKDISTEYSALMSKVMKNGTGKVKFPINEPATGKRKSQIQEYLEFHRGPGVQHIAMATDDIISTVEALRSRGVRFLRVPKTYYDEVPNRVGTIREDLEQLARLGILVDRDDDGYLLQIFTKPAHDRPTLFFEIIQREGSQGFGKGNFKALFEAIERDQAQRGNL
jgi:4-hydroxyphenylpyruvate dioxygenase